MSKKKIVVLSRRIQVKWVCILIEKDVRFPSQRMTIRNLSIRTSHSSKAPCNTVNPRAASYKKTRTWRTEYRTDPKVLSQMEHQ